ncbi:MAG: DUF4058 family protein [Nostocales cyanobacterium 94392]|nr:DUF4058 family protein [Nostocales cyanobacterium 94392]
MSYPFPGMNPYLEHPALWQKIHKRLIVAIADSLSPQLRPKYIVDIEERVYQNIDDDSVLVGIPDVAVKTSQTAIKSNTGIAVAAPVVTPLTVNLPMPETVRESYLEVRDVATKEVVTVIEVLSPKNKRSGEGRKTYDKKRLQVLGSSSHLVEIDLLRDGKPMTILDNHIQSDYSILVSRFEKRPKADLYAFNLTQNIPTFYLPLLEGDKEPLVNLQDLINGIYHRASYDLVIDYSQEPVPELSEENKVWVDDILKEQRLR